MVARGQPGLAVGDIEIDLAVPALLLVSIHTALFQCSRRIHSILQYSLLIEMVCPALRLARASTISCALPSSSQGHLKTQTL